MSKNQNEQPFNNAFLLAATLGIFLQVVLPKKVLTGLKKRDNMYGIRQAASACRLAANREEA
jgi:hypothetical protein